MEVREITNKHDGASRNGKNGHQKQESEISITLSGKRECRNGCRHEK